MLIHIILFIIIIINIIIYQIELQCMTYPQRRSTFVVRTYSSQRIYWTFPNRKTLQYYNEKLILICDISVIKGDLHPGTKQKVRRVNVHIHK